MADLIPEFLDSWDFMAGFKEALKPKTRPLKKAEAAEFSFNGRIPFVVLVPEFEDDGETPLTFIVKEEGLIGQLSFVKNVVENNGLPLSVAVEDVAGAFTYSTFYIRVISEFPLARPLFGSIRQGTKYNSQMIHDLGAMLLRKFIKAYMNAFYYESFKHDEPMKNKCNKNWIPELDRFNISPLKDTYVFDMEGNTLYSSLNTDYRGTGVGIGFNLGDDTLRILQKACLNELLPSVETYLRIAKRLHSRRDFEAYCIMLTAVLEKKVFDLYRKKLQSQGCSKEDIDKRMHTNRLRKGCTDSYETISVWKAIRVLCDGVPYENEDAYIEITKNLYEKRDEIIHGDAIFVGIEEANEMSISYVNFLNFLESKV